MPNHSISFAKLVSPPSATAWAQTYHAGNVYAVVSVEEITKGQDPEHALPSVLVTGKDIINNLEAEYFAIAEKNLHSIKEAVQNACKDIPENITATVLFAVLHEHILYIFLHGNGHIAIKRKEKFGTLLQSNGKTKDVFASSGKMEPGDIIMLATQEFTDVISHKELLEELAHPLTELTEHLSPKIDDEKYAGAAALIFSLADTREQQEVSFTSQLVHKQQTAASLPVIASETKLDSGEPRHSSIVPRNDTVEKEEPQIDLDAASNLEEEHPVGSSQNKKLHISLPRFKLSRRQLFFLTIIVVLVVILAGSILLNKGKQQNTQDLTAFNSAFPAAQQEYTEGKSLLALNKGLALDDFQKAKSSLEHLKAQLQSNSPQAAQVQTLLDRINKELSDSTNTSQATLTPVDASTSKLLSAEIANSSNTYFSADDNGTVYTIDTNGITNTRNKQTLVPNQKDWTTIGGFGTYLGNFYVVDLSSSQVLKFTKAASDYNKTNYFPSAPQTLSKAVSLTIDGDIWILSSDGTIQEFTKGKQDQFALQGLQEQLKNPTRIFTTADFDNLYVLDNGNSRIMVVKKTDGTITAEYDNAQLRTAKDIDVDEKNKKIFALISGKVYEIDMK